MEEHLGRLGEGIESASVIEVFVSPGDKVTAGQTLLELESSKAVVPIPASRSGTVTRISVRPGDTVTIGQVILEYDTAVGEPPVARPVQESVAPPPAPQTATVPAATSPPPFNASQPVPAASPTVRRLAGQLQIDLRRIPSTSRGGRIELEDIQCWLRELIAQTSGGTAASRDSDQGFPTTIPFEKWGAVRREPMSETRKAIGRHMVDSKNSQPHVTQFESVDITDLEGLRKEHAAAWKAAGRPLTLTVLAVKALVVALRKRPIFNSSLDETTDEIVYKDYRHIGIATDTEHGLMVPIVRNADQASLTEVAELIPQLAEKARRRELSADEMQGGSFTISNQGGIGGGHFTPIINRPETAILGIGRATLQAGVVGGRIAPRLMLPLTVSYDHRIIDGAAAVRFTLALVESLLSFTAEEFKLPESSPGKD